MELFNEAMIQLSTYSLITFSNLVPDALARTNCGWFLIIVTLITLSLNIVVVTGQNIKLCLRKYHLRQLRKMHENYMVQR